MYQVSNTIVLEWIIHLWECFWVIADFSRPFIGWGQGERPWIVQIMKTGDLPGVGMIYPVRAARCSLRRQRPERCFGGWLRVWQQIEVTILFRPSAAVFSFFFFPFVSTAPGNYSVLTWPFLYCTFQKHALLWFQVIFHRNGRAFPKGLDLTFGRKWLAIRMGSFLHWSKSQHVRWTS